MGGRGSGRRLGGRETTSDYRRWDSSFVIP